MAATRVWVACLSVFLLAYVPLRCSGDVPSYCWGLTSRDFASELSFQSFHQGRPDAMSCSFQAVEGCRPGYWEKNNETLPCCPGFFCPMHQVKLFPCVTGSFCPLVAPKDDPARLFLAPDFKHPGPSIEAKCPAGYYCTSPDEKVECGSGRFCRKGSVSEDHCPLLTYCGAGSEAPSQSGLGIFFSLFFLLFAFIFARICSCVRPHSVLSRSLIVHRHRLSVESCGETDLGKKLVGASDTNAEEAGPRPSLHPAPFTCQKPSSSRIDLEFRDLSLRLKGSKKVVLNGVTGEFKSSKLTAVMGASGSGKTTLLNVLAGKAGYGVMSGKILVNGAIDSVTNYKERMGFVPQDDVMVAELTVYENILLSSLLFLPHGTPMSARLSMVDTVIDVLDLKDVKGSPIGDCENRGISGGQRKRVNIGLELVKYPDILFLDEPTSGLDSTSSISVLRALRSIANLGLTIVTVVHQPRYEIFQMFDDVILLGKGGQTVYMGPTTNVVPYFESMGYHLPSFVNPADYVMDVINGTVILQGESCARELKWFFEHWQHFPRADEESSRVPQSRVNSTPDNAVEMKSTKLSRFFGNSSERASFAETDSVFSEGETIQESVCEDANEHTFPPRRPTITVPLEFQRSMSLRSEDSGHTPSFEPLQFLSPEDNLSASWRKQDRTLTKKKKFSKLVDSVRQHRDDLARLAFLYPFEAQFRVESVIQNASDVLRRAMVVLKTAPNKTAASAGPLAEELNATLEDLMNVKKEVGWVPTFFQFLYYFGVFCYRGILQNVSRSALKVQLTDLCLAMFAGSMLGVLNAGIELQDIIVANLLCMMAVSMTSSVAALRIFGNERLVFWREASSGINNQSYFMARNCAALPMMVLQPLMFLTMYYSFAAPRGYFKDYYLTLFATQFTSAGIGYLVSLIFTPSKAQTAVITVILTMTMLSGVSPTITQAEDMGGPISLMQSLSFTRWVSEALFLFEVENYSKVWDVEIEAMRNEYGYEKGNIAPCIGWVFAFGVFSRMLAYAVLCLASRERQGLAPLSSILKQWAALFTSRVKNLRRSSYSSLS